MIRALIAGILLSAGASRVERLGRRTSARELFGMLGVPHLAKALPRELSGGEAQRVAIARALAMDPRRRPSASGGARPLFPERPRRLSFGRRCYPF